MWRIGSAAIANALLVAGPVAILAGGRSLGAVEYWIALAGLTLAMLSELIAQATGRENTNGQTAVNRFGAWFNRLQGGVLLVSLQALFFVAATDHQSPSIGAVVAGLLVLVLATTLRCAAIVTLGTGFTDGFQPAGPIVRTGIYRWFRHPAEYGLLLLPIGASMVLGAANWLVLLWPPILLTSIARLWIEECGLRTACGSRPESLAFEIHLA